MVLSGCDFNGFRRVVGCRSHVIVEISPFHSQPHWESVLQDNSQHFYRADDGPADRSPALPGQPESACRAKAKNCACPSANQRAGLAQHFEEFHQVILRVIGVTSPFHQLRLDRSGDCNRVYTTTGPPSVHGDYGRRHIIHSKFSSSEMQVHSKLPTLFSFKEGTKWLFLLSLLPRTEPASAAHFSLTSIPSKSSIRPRWL